MKSVRHVSLLAALTVVGCTDGDDTSVVDPADPTAVEQVVEALGGAEALEGLDLLRIEASGNRRIDYEGLNPTEIVDVAAYSSVYWHDLGNDALRVDTSRTPLFEAFQFFPVEDYSVVLNGDVGGLPSQTGFFPPGPLPSGNVGADREPHGSAALDAGRSGRGGREPGGADRGPPVRPPHCHNGGHPPAPPTSPRRSSGVHSVPAARVPVPQADLGAADPSELLIEASSIDDLDPIERERLRQAVAKYRGDRSLLGLDDAELDGALGLTVTRDGRRVPTVTGILLIGREEAIRRHIPVHEVAFQLLNDTEVRVNDFYRWPLVRVFERVEEQFTAHLDETEIQVGLYRVPVPRVEQRAFREALINALTHRDYTRLGAVHVRWNRESLTVSNPGGFVDGVSLDNLLVTEPRPRNRQLADAIKRIGLAERTGRGVDLIYKGLLRYGRPPPDYSRSDARNVVVSLSCADADLEFLRLVIEEEDRLGTPLPLDTLIALSLLNRQKRVGVQELATAVQKDVSAARSVLERLVEVGLVEAHGIKKGRTYTLAPRVYREMGQADEYVRQAGFDRLQQEQMVRTYVREHGSIRRRDVIRLCRLSPQQATRLLARLVEEDVLARQGRGKGSVYEPGVNI